MTQQPNTPLVKSTTTGSYIPPPLPQSTTTNSNATQYLDDKCEKAYEKLEIVLEYSFDLVSDLESDMRNVNRSSTNERSEWTNPSPMIEMLQQTLMGIEESVNDLTHLYNTYRNQLSKIALKPTE